MRRQVFGVSVAVAVALTAGCSGTSADDAPGGGPTVDQPVAAESTTGSVQDEVKAGWPVSSVSLPGEPGADVGYCGRLDWSPVLDVLTAAGIGEVERVGGSWDEVRPSYWPSGGPDPVGRIVTGTCMSFLTSSGQPTSGMDSVVVQVWVFESSADTEAFWQSWDGNEQFGDPVPVQDVPGAQVAAMISHAVYVDRGFPSLFAAGGNVMVSVDVAYGSDNAQERTPTDPTEGDLLTAFESVASATIAEAAVGD